MRARLRAAVVALVVLAAGVLLGSALAQRLATGGEGAAVVEEPVGPRPTGRERVRVEVLNAGGVSGAARAATGHLRDAGFDVVYFGNAERFGRDTSLVLDRVGRLAAARDVADALGIRNVRSLPDSNLYLDVSVWLGTDWRAATDSTAAPPSARPWWDPRRWLPEGSFR